MLNIRTADRQDLMQIMSIYRYAQDYMIDHGNPYQWGHFYPDEIQIGADIAAGACKVLYDESGIHGVCALFTAKDPTYEHIEKGQWLNEEPYMTIHRLAGDGSVHGLFKLVVDYCKDQTSNIRVDTHADNITMQRLIEKNGFTRCGIIHVRNGSERIAYQWKSEKSKLN